jgi:hypothetical protein
MFTTCVEHYAARRCSVDGITTPRLPSYSRVQWPAGLPLDWLLPAPFVHAPQLQHAATVPAAAPPELLAPPAQLPAMLPQQGRGAPASSTATAL